MNACGACAKMTLTSLIDAILSVMSGFITEQCVSAIDFNPLFSSLENDQVLYFPHHIAITLSFPR